MSIDYTRAHRILSRRDPVIRDLMRRYGPCGLARAQHTDPFRALIHSIISQQLSTRAAATIEGRFRGLFGGVPTPSQVTATPDAQLIAALTQVKGIGRWTAEMFLMFRLHRPDVLPVDDLGIVKAVRQAYGLRTLPTPKRLVSLGESWRPYRSVACWYLWASLDNTPLKE